MSRHCIPSRTALRTFVYLSQGHAVAWWLRAVLQAERSRVRDPMTWMNFFFNLPNLSGRTGPWSSAQVLLLLGDEFSTYFLQMWQSMRVQCILIFTELRGERVSNAMPGWHYMMSRFVNLFVFEWDDTEHSYTVCAHARDSYICICLQNWRPPLWSGGQSSWLQIKFLNVMTFLHISLPEKGQQYNRLDCKFFFLFYKCDGIVTYKFT
jgi:hypothetical protein